MHQSTGGWGQRVGHQIIDISGESPESLIKGIFNESNNIFLWYESEDINKKSLFPKFQLILILPFLVMHDYVRFIAPIVYCVE